MKKLLLMLSLTSCATLPLYGDQDSDLKRHIPSEFIEKGKQYLQESQISTRAEELYKNVQPRLEKFARETANPFFFRQVRAATTRAQEWSDEHAVPFAGAVTFVVGGAVKRYFMQTVVGVGALGALWIYNKVQEETTASKTQPQAPVTTEKDSSYTQEQSDIDHEA